MEHGHLSILRVCLGGRGGRLRRLRRVDAGLGGERLPALDLHEFSHVLSYTGGHFQQSLRTEQVEKLVHLFTAKAERQNTQINSSGEGLESTCRAIEDALFGRYPKTRYKTSFVGPFPSWFFVAFVNSLPDRLVDWLKSNQDIMFALLKLKRYLVSSRFL